MGVRALRVMTCLEHWLWLCIDVYIHPFFSLTSGAVYKFNDINLCNHLGAESVEVDLLIDGDVSTCETRNGTTVELFGLFLDHIHRRHIAIIVIGSHMDCNPASGLHVAISSTSDQNYICKLKFSNAPDRCHYKCSCMGDDVCSHVIIGILGTDIEEICEIKFGWR